MIIENVFQETRQPGDIDLIDEIIKILESAKHPNPSKWAQDYTMNEALTAHPKLQRFLINRYWRIQLGLCPVSTTRERFSLVDTGSFDDYLNIFRVAVAPSIVKYNLAL